MSSQGGLNKFVKSTRTTLTSRPKAVRRVLKSELAASIDGIELKKYIADRTPLFYRQPSHVANTLFDGYFLTAIHETLNKLPDVKSFQESHFGEITAGIFAEEIAGLKLLYNKLSVLTAQNSNAYKMDFVAFRPNTAPLELVFCEVKCSPKSHDQNKPAGHDKSCYSDIFRSLKDYGDADMLFDLTAARDNLRALPDQERGRVIDALKPYSDVKKTFAAFALIDLATFCEDESAVLQTRKNDKSFEVDLVCIEDFGTVAGGVYALLENYRSLG